MDTAVQHFPPRAPRVPLDDVPVTMAPEGFHQEFEASATNVGVGGLSMRASVVPQIGSRLRCEFQCPGGEHTLRVIGEVVWTQEAAADTAEFGVRFTDLKSDDFAELEHFVASVKGRDVELFDDDEVSGVHDMQAIEGNEEMKIALQGVATAIVTRVRSRNSEGIEVEQPLPFLTLGTKVECLQSGKNGWLRDVHLRYEGNTPKLVLGIGYGEQAEQERMDTLDGSEPMATAEPREETMRQSDVPQFVSYPPEQDIASEARSLMTNTGVVVTAILAACQRAYMWIATQVQATLPKMAATVSDALGTAQRFVVLAWKNISSPAPRRRTTTRRSAKASKNGRPQPKMRLRWLILLGLIPALLWLGYSQWRAANPPSISEVSVGEPVMDAQQRAMMVPPPPPLEAKRAPTPVSGTSFGADNIADGRKFVLQMSRPVKRIEGLAQDDGFSVTIPDSLSLSRAGPIAQAHPHVHSAMILNHGDRSELSVVLAPGQRPSYRVEAVGATLEITLAAIPNS